MAGNANSIIALTTQGRGGRVPETLPRSNRSYTIYKQNSRYRCQKCKTIIGFIPRKMIKSGHIECPYCHSVNTIITISRRNSPSVRQNSDIEIHVTNIQKLIKSKPNHYSLKDIANLLDLPYQNVVYYANKLSSELRSLLANKRGRPKLVIEPVEV